MGRTGDLWGRLRAGFALPAFDDAHVRNAERWYAARPEFVVQMMERARRYLPYIVEQVAERGMPMEIALLPAVESAFKPQAYSRARAAGLWQFIPATAQRYGLRQNHWYDGRRDVVHATRAALDYLEFLHREFDGDWFLALAGYNAGEANIRRAVEYNRRLGLPTGYRHLTLRSETRRYVPKLIAIRNLVAEPERFGVALPELPDVPYFATVEVPGRVHLATVARVTGVPETEIVQLNPAWRQRIIDTGPRAILVPAAHVERAKAGLASVPTQPVPELSTESAAPEKRAAPPTREVHVVRRGETLHGIAQAYGLTVTGLKQANRLRSNLIYPGQVIDIPRGGRTAVAATAAGGEPRRRVRAVHRVRPGDTLWRIAQRYRVLVHQLAAWNSLRVSDVLHLGQRIEVWAN